MTEFAVGDRVFGTAPNFGGHAEFVCRGGAAPLAHMPAGLDFEDAAAVPRRRALRPGVPAPRPASKGQKVVVYGASGSVGTAAVQLARHFGADVTAVCNTPNVELVRSLGADGCIDYTRGEDFTKNRATYDIVVDAVGKLTFRRCKDSLKSGGVYVATDGLLNFPLVLWTRWFGDKKRVVLDARTGRRRTCAS